MNSYSERLIQKIKQALSDINEVSVLYTLVQLSKALQDSGRKLEFPTINLYRDWLVHTDLDRNKLLAEFFKQWDEIIEGIQNGTGVLDATNKCQEALAFGNLFTELESLEINLEVNQRYLFINALVGAVIDAPLRWGGEHVKEFRFTYEPERKQKDSSYFCHMQIQLTQGSWFNGPELHFLANS
jgi:hypothetical protein